MSPNALLPTLPQFEWQEEVVTGKTPKKSRRRKQARGTPRGSARNSGSKQTPKGSAKKGGTGSSGKKGSRKGSRKSDVETPTRRSTRNSRLAAMEAEQLGLVSATSGDGSDDGSDEGSASTEAAQSVDGGEEEEEEVDDREPFAMYYPPVFTYVVADPADINAFSWMDHLAILFGPGFTSIGERYEWSTPGFFASPDFDYLDMTVRRGGLLDSFCVCECVCV